MASVNSVSSSSSLYGTRNVISGLASGMDTESMIQNAISGYKMKISALQQKRTKLEWQQEAYRSMIAKSANISSKYTSYTSSTNLASRSFFTNAVNMVTGGANKDKVSATGKTNSTVQIDRVRQLASAARYSASGAKLGDGTVTATETFNLNDYTDVSNISGQIQLAYGGKDSPSYAYVDIGSRVYTSAQDLVDDINAQLSENDTIRAELGDDGSVKFVNKKNDQETIRITDAYGDTRNMVTELSTKDNWVSSFKFDPAVAVKREETSENLKDAALTITLDGQTKNIKGPTKEEAEKLAANMDGGASDENVASAYVQLLQERIDKAFGKVDDNTSKLKVENVAADKASGDIRLQFSAADGNGSSFKVTSDKSSTLGTGGTIGLSNNVNTGTTMKQLADQGIITAKKAEDGSDAVDENGRRLFQFSVNGVDFELNEDTAMETLINRINSSEAGVKVTYSQTTGKFSFEARETGKAGNIEFGENMKSIFGDPGDPKDGATYVEGKDAIFDVTINGDKMTLTRSSNIVDLDGMSVTLKGTFGYDAAGNAIEDTEAVTFTSNVNTEKILNAVKAFIEDYNALATEVKNAYSTLPVQRNNGSYYEPLTEDDEADMSDNAIEKWNEKAKTGMLFGDSNISGFYSALTSAVSLTGDDGAYLRHIGIEMAYSNGLSTITLDEKKFLAALESEPDKVADIFTKSKDNGSSSNGLMASLSTALDKYTKTTGYPKGILVDRAGSVLSPSNLYTNYMQKQLDAMDKEISKWQDKMSDKVDYYTSKFSRLEQLVATMNSQSSALSQMTGM